MDEMTTPSPAAMRAADRYVTLFAANILDGYPNPTVEEIASIIDAEYREVIEAATKVSDAVGNADMGELVDAAVALRTALAIPGGVK